MRIISKYRDFYDTAGYIDQSTVFLREQKEIERPFAHPDRFGYNTNAYVLGFCGKYYPYIHKVVEQFTHPKTGRLIPTQHYYFYELDEFFDSPFYSDREYRWSRKRSKEGYINFFNYWTDSDDLFIELDAPYFKVTEFDYRYSNGNISKAKLKTNPSLIDMQFGKVKDAFTIFQEVEMYLTNQLVKRQEPDEIDDKYRIAQHGYDKYSFRHPTKLKDLK